MGARVHSTTRPLLHYEFTLLVPLRYRDRRGRIRTVPVRAIERRLARRFGGFTASPPRAPYDGSSQDEDDYLVSIMVIVPAIQYIAAMTYFRSLQRRLEQRFAQRRILIRVWPTGVIRGL